MARKEFDFNTATSRQAKAVALKLMKTMVPKGLMTHDGIEFDQKDVDKAVKGRMFYMDSVDADEIEYDDSYFIKTGVNLEKALGLVDGYRIYSENEGTELFLTDKEFAALTAKSKRTPDRMVIPHSDISAGHDITLTSKGVLGIGCQQFPLEYWRTDGDYIVRSNIGAFDSSVTVEENDTESKRAAFIYATLNEMLPLFEEKVAEMKPKRAAKKASKTVKKTVKTKKAAAPKTKRGNTRGR